MPFYKLLCITAHYPEYVHIKELVTQSARLIMDQGGVVRTLQAQGTRTLPQRMRRHKQWHSIGDYWTMHFDASPRLLRQLDGKLRADPRVVRWTVLRLGAALDNVVEPPERTIIPGESALTRASARVVQEKMKQANGHIGTAEGPPAFR